MPGLIKISEAASLGLHALAYLALIKKGPPGSTTRAMANAMKVSEAHLAKVMQRLEHHGFVGSKRGPNGGFYLQRSAEDLSLYDIYTAIEGAINTTLCLLGQPICTGRCPLGPVFREHEKALINHLKTTSLQAFASQSGMEQLERSH